jgi:hypothetical protein
VRQLRGELNGLEAESQKRLFGIDKLRKQLHMVSSTAHTGGTQGATVYQLGHAGLLIVHPYCSVQPACLQTATVF